MDAAGVRAVGLTRRFSEVEALRGLDFSAPPGQVTALVGPNGAGKTTLLLVLATLLRPDAGTVEIGGLDPVHAPTEVRRLVGWSPDVFGVYDNLTPREYLTFFGQAYLMPPAAARERAGELLAGLGLAELSDRPVHGLSRGEKQRLGLARALVHRPQVVLLDEPASGLDPRNRIALRDLLSSLATEGACVVVSSHVLSDLEDLAHRVVFVDRGRTVGVHDIGALRRDERRRWSVSALDPARLVRALDRLGRTHTHAHPDAAAVVEIASDEDAADLLARLVADGVRVSAFAPSGGALEAAYLRLTEERT